MKEQVNLNAAQQWGLLKTLSIGAVNLNNKVTTVRTEAQRQDVDQELLVTLMSLRSVVDSLITQWEQP